MLPTNDKDYEYEGYTDFYEFTLSLLSSLIPDL